MAIQEPMNYAAEVFARSGTVGMVTALVFFVCVGIGLERLLFWMGLWGPAWPLRRMLRRGARRTEGEVEDLVRRGHFRQAAQKARRTGNPAFRLLAYVLERLRRPAAWRSTRDHVLASTVGGNVTHGRRFLITAIQAFGLLGMLGTCKGLYTQLSSLGASPEPGALNGAMGGMGEAFTTTLVGLTAAALATLIYLPNEIAIEHFERELRRANGMIEAALAECDATDADRRSASDE